MKKTSRNILLSLTCALAFLCFALFGMSFTFNVAKAATALDVSKITQTDLRAYNDTANYKGQGSNYLIEFNQDVFATTIANGTVLLATDSDWTSSVSSSVPSSVKTELTAFLDAVTINGAKLSAVTDGYAVIKADENALVYVSGRAIGYVEFAFPQGATLGGKAFASAKTFYEYVDRSFSTTQEPFKIISLWERPLADSSQYLNNNGKGSGNGWYISFNRKITLAESDSAMWKNATITTSTLDNVAFCDQNAVPISCIGAVASTGKMPYFNDWDKGSGGYNTRFYIENSAIANGATITFKAGFTIGSYALAEDQTFIIGKGSGAHSGDMRFAMQKNADLSVESFSVVSGLEDTTAVYSLKFGGQTDLFSAFAVNADVTDFFKHNTNLYRLVSINGKILEVINKTATVSVKKTAVNTVEISVGQKTTVVTSASVGAGLFINNKILGSTFSDSISYIEADTYVSVKNITAETNYGSMSANTLVRFSLRLSDLGIFADMPLGKDITEYCNVSSFTDNIIFNGLSLTEIFKGDTGVSLSVYRGNKDKVIYEGVAQATGKQNGTALVGKYDVSDAIEIVINNAQIFDYTITVKEGCSLGDIIVSDTVTYKKAYDESFELVTTEDSVVKPIAIREIPYGAVANTRQILVIFNKAVSLKSSASLVENATFNGEKITTGNGGKAINPEKRYGNRQYYFFVDFNTWTNIMMAEDAEIVIPALELSDGTFTEAVTFNVINGSWAPEGTDPSSFKAPAFVEALEYNYRGNDSFSKNTALNDADQAEYNLYDRKLVRLVLDDYGFNHYISGGNLFNTVGIYYNGVKLTAENSRNSGVEKEAKWELNVYSVYVSNKIRNYVGGIDVIYIPKGTIVSAGRIVPNDTYIYSTIDKSTRSDASWVWKSSLAKPALKFLDCPQATIGDDVVTATVNFDRITGKNDVKFGVYSNVDPKSFVKVNGKLLSEYSGSVYEWTDNGLTINLKKSELASDFEESGLNLTFLDGFKTPLGYSFDEQTEYYYSFVNGVWTSAYEGNANQFTANSISAISDITTVRSGDKVVEGQTVPKLAKRFTVSFANPLAGSLGVEGSNVAKFTVFRNITAPYYDLVRLTELGYESDLRGAGYEYLDYVVNKLVSYGVRDSILNNVLINNQKVRDILQTETAYESLNNYPFRIDIDGNDLVFTIQEDSVIYDDITDGFELIIGKKIIFEAESKTTVNSGYIYNASGAENAKFTQFTWTDGITVVNLKQTYYVGETLDLTKIIAYYRGSDDAQADYITVTANMLSAYDNTVKGEQTITLTVTNSEGTFTDTFTVNFIEEFEHSDINVNQNSGCGGNVVGSGVVCVVALALCCVVVVFRKLRKD